MTQSPPSNPKPAKKPKAKRASGTVAAAAANADVGYALRILSGLHIGASRPIAEKEMILVGSGEDCDIVLSDHGVAPHHVLIGLLGGSLSVRALDAPLRVGGQPLHPGDPVALAALQRVELGQAALAVGNADDPAWQSMLPAYDGSRPAPVPAPYMKRLPAVAAFAVLSLMSVAILAAVLPRGDHAPQASDALTRLIPEFSIADGKVAKDANGIAVLSGTVRDAATRDRIREKIKSEGLSASLSLRTGDDIAFDVREILRAEGFATRTQYLGNGDVEVTGNFADGNALKEAALGRAMRDVKGVRRIIPRNYDPIDPFQPAAQQTVQQKAAEQQPMVGLVSIVRGKEPHVLGSDGSKFGMGEKLPDGSTLIGITTEGATALDTEGKLQRVQLAPPPAPAAAEATTVAVGVDAKAAPAAAQASAAPATKAAAAATDAVAKPAAPATAPAQPQTVAKAKPQPAQRM